MRSVDIRSGIVKIGSRGEAARGEAMPACCCASTIVIPVLSRRAIPVFDPTPMISTPRTGCATRAYAMRAGSPAAMRRSSTIGVWPTVWAMSRKIVISCSPLRILSLL